VPVRRSRPSPSPPSLTMAAGKAGPPERSARSTQRWTLCSALSWRRRAGRRVRGRAGAAAGGGAERIERKERDEWGEGVRVWLRPAGVIRLERRLISREGEGLFAKFPWCARRLRARRTRGLIDTRPVSWGESSKAGQLLRIQIRSQVRNALTTYRSFTYPSYSGRTRTRAVGGRSRSTRSRGAGSIVFQAPRATSQRKSHHAPTSSI
jgi:hypothetical protein